MNWDYLQFYAIRTTLNISKAPNYRLPCCLLAKCSNFPVLKKRIFGAYVQQTLRTGSTTAQRTKYAPKHAEKNQEMNEKTMFAQLKQGLEKVKDKEY